VKRSIEERERLRERADFVGGTVIFDFSSVPNRLSIDSQHRDEKDDEGGGEGSQERERTGWLKPCPPDMRESHKAKGDE
jgi:hypothetical protein